MKHRVRLGLGGPLVLLATAYGFAQLVLLTRPGVVAAFAARQRAATKDAPVPNAGDESGAANESR